MLRPQNSEKFASICEKDAPPMTIVVLELNKLGWKAVRMRFRYDLVRPLPPALANGPNTLSFEATTCFPSGVSPISFLPSSANFRPLHDISVGLFGGPTDCDAALPGLSCTATGCAMPLASVTNITALGSVVPAMFTPLKISLARPSQKFRKLNAAPMTLGALRPVTRRVFTGPTWNTGSATSRQLSAAAPLSDRKSRL